MELIKCAVCNSDNMDFSLRCNTCGSLLQQRAKTIDLFSTIYNLWRYPDFAFRKILLAEHRNYVTLIGLLEAVRLSFFGLFIVKASDVFSIELPRLLLAGFGLAVVVYLPFLYFFSSLSYLSARVSRTGASLRGFLASVIYGLHPIAVSAVIVLPVEIAIFGPYVFSNNPSPLTINPIPFYFLESLDGFLGFAAIAFVLKLAKLLFGARKKAAIFVGIFFILLIAVVEIVRRILVN